MTPTLPILASVIGVSLLSIIGGFFLVLHNSILQRIMLPLLGFSTGTLLGDVFLHMLPELVEENLIVPTTWLLILAGILLSFILEKFIHWHHCHHTDHAHYHPVGIMNTVGDILHNALDGMLIAGSFLLNIELGIATTIAIIFHEIPQEISDIGILIHSGLSKAKALLFNGLTGVAGIIGAVIVLLIGSLNEQAISLYVIPLAAGNFLYVATADLIPELHKETKTWRSMVQLLSIILGIGFMWTLTLME